MEIRNLLWREETIPIVVDCVIRLFIKLHSFTKNHSKLSKKKKTKVIPAKLRKHLRTVFHQFPVRREGTLEIQLKRGRVS